MNACSETNHIGVQRDSPNVPRGSPCITHACCRSARANLVDGLSFGRGDSIRSAYLSNQQVHRTGRLFNALPEGGVGSTVGAS